LKTKKRLNRKDAKNAKNLKIRENPKTRTDLLDAGPPQHVLKGEEKGEGLPRPSVAAQYNAKQYRPRSRPFPLLNGEGEMHLCTQTE
jgi:hypothetical protein